MVLEQATCAEKDGNVIETQALIRVHLWENPRRLLTVKAALHRLQEREHRCWVNEIY